MTPATILFSHLYQQKGFIANAAKEKKSQVGLLFPLPYQQKVFISNAAKEKHEKFRASLPSHFPNTSSTASLQSVTALSRSFLSILSGGLK